MLQWIADGRCFEKVRHLIEYLLMVSLLTIVSVCCAGCIWLALPGLAYEGYQLDRRASRDSSQKASARQSRNSKSRFLRSFHRVARRQIAAEATPPAI
jgi:hypothetical protein